MQPAGRPREFTSNLRTDVINLVAQGATVEEAAQLVGVSLRTVQRDAKDDPAFRCDLDRALDVAPVEPQRLMQRAARTHWRAAAWMLERTDPDRYGRRPSNSCSAEKLQDIMSHLIELALEATSPEQRAEVYKRMRPAAEKALETLLPSQREGQRWLASLATRPTPLLDHESQEDNPEEDDDQPPLNLHESDPQPGRPRSSSDLDPPSRPASEQTGRGPAAVTPGVRAPASAPSPPIGGIMSPKMRFATKSTPPELPATETATTIAPGVASGPPVAPKQVPKRSSKSTHLLVKAEARRVRRRIARAKRRGRKAA